MIPILVNLLAFAAIFLAVFAVNAILVDMHSSERKKVKQRMEEQFKHQQRAKARSSPLIQDFSQIAADAKAENPSDRNLRQSLQFLVEQSGIDITVKRLLTMSAVSGIVVAGIGLLLVGNLFVALGVGIVAAAIPLLYIRFKRARRLSHLREQLPDAFELMSRVLRAGQTISQAMKCVSDEFDRPISLEFLYCYEQMNLGLSPEGALRDLARRTGLLEMKIFVLAVVVHRQTGGNLAELLDKLSAVVRERFRIAGMIQSLTAQGRFQAGILLSMPPAMFVLLLVLHYEYEIILLQYPMMIVFALTMMTLGVLWVRKIVNFDY